MRRVRVDAGEQTAAQQDLMPHQRQEDQAQEGIMIVRIKMVTSATEEEMDDFINEWMDSRMLNTRDNEEGVMINATVDTWEFE
jgi:hypothetical protein